MKKCHRPKDVHPVTTNDRFQMSGETNGTLQNDGSSQIRDIKENSTLATLHGKTKKEKKKGKQTPRVQENTEHMKL
jgi:hypothetical protein